MFSTSYHVVYNLNEAGFEEDFILQGKLQWIHELIKKKKNWLLTDDLQIG